MEESWDCGSEVCLIINGREYKLQKRKQTEGSKWNQELTVQKCKFKLEATCLHNGQIGFSTIKCRRADTGEKRKYAWRPKSGREGNLTAETIRDFQIIRAWCHSNIFIIVLNRIAKLELLRLFSFQNWIFVTFLAMSKPAMSTKCNKSSKRRRKMTFYIINFIFMNSYGLVPLRTLLTELQVASVSSIFLLVSPYHCVPQMML